MYQCMQYTNTLIELAPAVDRGKEQIDNREKTKKKYFFSFW